MHLARICFVFVCLLPLSRAQCEVSATRLRCEYRVDPLGIDQQQPRLNWIVESNTRGETQTAYRILVASTLEKLSSDEGDLWDSGKVSSNQTIHISYDGVPLKSKMHCFWKVRSWGQDDEPSAWSKPAKWSMGLLADDDWIADYISYRDDTPVFKDRDTHFLPPARHYRKDFSAEKKIARATIYSTALGIYELDVNGQRVGDAYFAPGWTDYRKRAYYQTYDVTALVNDGENSIGAIVADGWYSGYVGFGLLTGIGTESIGRYTYGKTPSLMAQLEIEYEDGSREIVGTDKTWKVTADGPIREADLLMGESYDARKFMSGWSNTGFDDSQWQNAILASENGPQPATFVEFRNPTKKGGPKKAKREIDLSFKRPRLEAFPGVPVRVTEEIKTVEVSKREAGSYIFNLGQNFAGTIRLKVKGPAGHRLTIRYGEMLHPDGRLMTENLRRARATDYYVCKGDPKGEVYSPRFTFHGFQYVEVSNFPGEPAPDAVTGLVLHSDTPLTSAFECSDPMVNQVFRNVVWTQRANFLDLPTDCPQRDERMGWTGDAQAYVATAAYNADIGAFYTKWLRELMESQRPSGAFPGYAPYPFQHGWDFGSAWADAGVICPWTIWQAYGDTQVIETCWEPMTRFMQWRKQTSRNNLGVSHGNNWGDWLAQGAKTPLDYVDTIYFAISSSMMADMADAVGRKEEATAYRRQFELIKAAFAEKFLEDDGSMTVNTQTAQALALFANLVPASQRAATGKKLAKMIGENGNHMATGFLGTRVLLPALSSAGQHDLAVFLLQSHEFPSWGYEVDQGATTIWERWDSYTKEDAFGRHNAAMNSFSHYAFGAVCEWMFRTLAGIDSGEPGYASIVIRPNPPTRGSNAMHEPIDWVRASYDSIRGTIRSDWKVEGEKFYLNVSVPTNTTATVYLPNSDPKSITEGGKSIDEHPHARVLRTENGCTVLAVASGTYEFAANNAVPSAKVALRTSLPKDNSTNPDGLSLEGAKKLAHWNFTDATDVEQWQMLHNCEIRQQADKTYLVATGADSQIATTLEQPLVGNLAVEIRVIPGKGAGSQLFWAMTGGGFNGQQQETRQLRKSDQAKNYLFAITSTAGISKLRFDPFDTYDKYADAGKMQIESITIYQVK